MITSKLPSNCFASEKAAVGNISSCGRVHDKTVVNVGLSRHVAVFAGRPSTVSLSWSSSAHRASSRGGHKVAESRRLYPAEKCEIGPLV